MEIISKNASLLSNFEVFGLLQQTKEDLARKVIEKKTNRHKTNRAICSVELQNINIDKHLPTVIYESLRFLEPTACVNQSTELIENFLKKLDARKTEFNLTKIEKLQLINQRPISAVELQVLIEDSEERFTLEQMDELLDIVLESFPAEENPEAIASNQTKECEN